jgi:DNA-binding LacI/PurR family transcriptional regulator
VIGLLAPIVSDALASQVMQGVEEEAQERGYAVMLGRTGAKSAFIAGYLRTLRTYRGAGVILISAVITPETRQLLGPNVPIISVAISDKSGSPSVAIDDEQAAYDATRHLLRLGHRRIGLLTGDPASVYVAQPRERGYLRAMTEAKMHARDRHRQLLLRERRSRRRRTAAAGTRPHRKLRDERRDGRRRRQ